jgi:integrase
MRGHITERRPGVWLVRVDGELDPVTGRRRQPSRTLHGTRRDAELELAQLMVDVGKGLLPSTSATVGLLLERWFEHAESRLSPTTLRGYRRLAQQRIIPRFGQKKLADVTTAELDRFYDGLIIAGLGPQTVRNIHSVIRRAYAHALRWGWASVNPATNTQPPTVPKRRRESLSAEQVQRAVAVAGEVEAEFGVFLRLAFATGARRGELCALRWSDLDTETGTLRIARSIAAVAGGWVEKTTKTDKERTVTLDRGTLDVLAGHRKLMAERAAEADVTDLAGSFMFSYRLDGSLPWHPDTATHRWWDVKTAADLPAWARLHDVRHAHASLLIDGGVPVSAVSERLGHANQNVTLDIYTHAFKARDAEAAALIGGLLDGDVGVVGEPDGLEGPAQDVRNVDDADGESELRGPDEAPDTR